jgi:hypothetical protein
MRDRSKSFIVSLSKRDNKDETKEPTETYGGHAQKIKRKNGSTNRKEKMIAELLSPQAMRF